MVHIGFIMELFKVSWTITGGAICQPHVFSYDLCWDVWWCLKLSENHHQQETHDPAALILLQVFTKWLSPFVNLRSLSEVQESAQLLTGSDFPKAVLESLVGKLTATSLILINCTPYDACLESTLLTWQQFEEKKFDFLSISRNVTIVEYVEKKIAFQLLQAFFVKKCLCWGLLRCIWQHSHGSKIELRSSVKWL